MRIGNDPTPVFPDPYALLQNLAPFARGRVKRPILIGMGSGSPPGIHLGCLRVRKGLAARQLQALHHEIEHLFGEIIIIGDGAFCHGHHGGADRPLAAELDDI